MARAAKRMEMGGDVLASSRCVVAVIGLCPAAFAKNHILPSPFLLFGLGVLSKPLGLSLAYFLERRLFKALSARFKGRLALKWLGSFH